MGLTVATPSRIQTFNPRLVAGLILAGIVAFAAFAWLSAYAEDFRSGRDGRPHALSVSATGFQGLVRLVDRVGGSPRLVRSEADLETEDLLVVTLEAHTDADALAALLDTRDSQATLLILPKWATMPDPRHSGWVLSVGPHEDAPVLSEALGPLAVEESEDKGPGGRATGRNLLEGLEVAMPSSPRSISGESILPLLTGPDGRIVLGQVDGRPLFILADPDLMNNLGLKDPATARTALLILGRLNTTDATGVAFDLTLNGFGRKPGLLKLPFEPPFLALTVALLAAALLAGLHGAFRFGPEMPEERAIPFGKLALVENSAGLIQLAGREHRTGGAYAELIGEAAAQASGAPASLRGEALEAYLDRLSPPDAPRFSQLADRARQASDRHELLSAARALFAWKKEYVR